MKKILFLDIDDTLLVSKNMFIYVKYKDKDEDKENDIKLNTIEYAKFSFSNLKNIIKIDYRDFDNPNKIKESFYSGKPLFENLKLIDNYIENGWELGVLTARGEEKVIKENIKIFLKKYLKNDFVLNIKNIYAVGDKNISYYGKDVYYKKLFILKKYLKKYDRIRLLDDSSKIGKLIKKYNNIGLSSKNIEFINV